MIVCVCAFFSFFLDAPVCASAHEELLGALKHETLALKCEVDASPPADSFHWTFNSSGEPTDLSAKLQSSEVCYDLISLIYKHDASFMENQTKCRCVYLVARMIRL